MVFISVRRVSDASLGTFVYIGFLLLFAFLLKIILIFFGFLAICFPTGIHHFYTFLLLYFIIFYIIFILYVYIYSAVRYGVSVMNAASAQRYFLRSILSLPT